MISRLTKYLALNEKENDNNQIDRFGQFDVAYHNISFDEDETDQGWKFFLCCKNKVLSIYKLGKSLFETFK